MSRRREDDHHLRPASVAALPFADVTLAARIVAQCGSSTGEESRTALLAHLSDADLRVAWQVSSIRLRRLQHMPRRTVAFAAVALERSWYIDEIERRSPDDFAGWLRSRLP